MLGLWLSIYGLLMGTICSLKAKEKNRHTKNWFLIGFIFGVFAYMVLLFLPNADSENELISYKIADA